MYTLATSKSKTKDIILIIEDNLFMAELLVEKLGNEGLNAVSVYDGEDALGKISREKPSLVLLDVSLSGGIDGMEVLSRIRSSYDKKSLPVITLFNLNDPKGIEQVLKLGVNGYLIKAFTDTEEIIASVKDSLKNKDKLIVGRVKTSKETGVEAPKVLTVQPIKVLEVKPEVAIEFAKKFKSKIENALKTPETEISIISLVDDLIEYAFWARASDIHMEPFGDSLSIRLRIDGILHDSFSFAKSLQSGVITRIKVLGGIRTDEHQAALDGRFKAMVKNPTVEFDIRVSIIPTYYGENAVLRLLAEQTKISKLNDLAFTDNDKIKIKNAVSKPHGMILATGPTGSGKTTTLYTILKEVNTREVSIITIEDPIEYSLEGIDQIQVNTRTGLTFANGLRSILRQDPNVIMVGEIRDQETAGIAVNAALTGHKLLSTIHTNDAATTLPRLLDMGVEPFLVASTINIAIGQRLVRMICEKCKTKKRITEAEFKNLAEHIPAEVVDGHRDFYYGKGCSACGDTGYFSRMGLYEVLEMNDFIREAIMRRADAGEVKKIAVKNGMVPLLEDGFRKALAGFTTIEEILRVVRE